MLVTPPANDVVPPGAIESMFLPSLKTSLKTSTNSSRPASAWRVLGMVGLVLWTPCGLCPLSVQADDAPVGEQFFRQLDGEQAADLEHRLRKLYADVAPTVVRVYPQGVGGGGWVSGVIVSRSGEIFTCAHHDLPPDTKVDVELFDGTRVKATTRGLVKNPAVRTHYRAHDVGLIQLDEERDWPAAPLGLPSDLDNGQLCVAIGHPNTHEPGQPPLLRLGRVLPPLDYGRVRSS